MEILKDWIIGLCAASIIVSAAVTLTPDGNMKKTVRFIGGLILFIVIIQPVISFDMDAMAFNTMQYRADYEGYEDKLIFVNSAHTKLIIEDRTRTYILQKAELLGLDCEVEVRARTEGDGYPYPYSLTGSYLGGEKELGELKRYIESELAIPAERQEWSVNELSH